MLLALLISLAPPASSATKSEPTDAQSSALPDTPARRAVALRIAQSAQPVELLKFGTIKGFQDATRIMMKQDAELATLERQYQGFAEELIRRMTPQLADAVVAAVPALWSKMSDVYVAELSDAELAKFDAFMSSPAARKLIRQTYANFDVAPMLQGSGKETSTADAAVQATLNATAVAAQQLTDAELVEVARFELENREALMRVTPKIIAALAGWDEQVINAPNIDSRKKVMAELEAEMAAERQPKR